MNILLSQKEEKECEKVNEERNWTRSSLGLYIGYYIKQRIFEILIKSINFRKP